MTDYQAKQMGLSSIMTRRGRHVAEDILRAARAMFHSTAYEILTYNQERATPVLGDVLTSELNEVLEDYQALSRKTERLAYNLARKVGVRIRRRVWP